MSMTGRLGATRGLPLPSFILLLLKHTDWTQRFQSPSPKAKYAERSASPPIAGDLRAINPRTPLLRLDQYCLTLLNCQ
jgi:hypothetical protein